MSAFAITSGEVLVSASGISHFFGEGDSRTQVLFDNSIEVPSGQMTILTGPSGSGKTTLLTLIGALRTIQTGELRVLGRDLRGLDDAALTIARRQIGFIFQMHNLFESLTALENVMMASQVAGIPQDDGRRRSIELLKRLGLGHRIDYKPQALSGGQRQRIAVARALVSRPRLILADEPTAALDSRSGQEVVNLLKEMLEENESSVLMVTHDHRIMDCADRLVNMVDGRIVSDVMVKEAVIICEFLKTIELFAELDVTRLSGIAEKMLARPFCAGEALIRQGDVGEEFFLLRDGTVEVSIADTSGASRVVATLEQGACFGERALLKGDVRAATVTGKSAGLAYVLKKPDFEAAMNASHNFASQLRSLYLYR